MGQTKYTYPVVGNGQRLLTEDGPLAGDATDVVTATNRWGRRAGRTTIGRTNSAVSAWNGYVNAAYDAAGHLANA